MNNNNRGDVILEAINVTKKFGQLNVLEGFNLSIKRGEFVSLIGPSGCGKTTLLKILAGNITSFSGQINYRLNDRLKLFCSVAFQDSALFPWLNIFNNIKICLNHGFMSGSEKDRAVLTYLKKVNLLDFKEYFPGELSEGMIQRVNVARAFASYSEIILMDEPFVHLDFLNRVFLQKLTLNILEKESRTIFFITHNIHEAVTLADRVIVMSSRPGRNIKEFNVNIPRPRDTDKIREDKQYLVLVKEITELLSDEVRKSQAELEKWIKEKRLIS